MYSACRCTLYSARCVGRLTPSCRTCWRGTACTRSGRWFQRAYSCHRHKACSCLPAPRSSPRRTCIARPPASIVSASRLARKTQVGTHSGCGRAAAVRAAARAEVGPGRVDEGLVRVRAARHAARAPRRRVRVVAQRAPDAPPRVAQAHSRAVAPSEAVRAVARRGHACASAVRSLFHRFVTV